MKLHTKALASALVFAAALAATATAASADRWIKIHNQTSVVLYRFYASLTNTESWGQDRMGSKQIPPGYTSTINLNGARKGCYFDIRAEFADGDVLEKFGVDVCGGYDTTYHE